MVLFVDSFLTLTFSFLLVGSVTETEPRSSSSDDNDSSGMIIIVAVVAALACLLLVLLILVLRARGADNRGKYMVNEDAQQDEIVADVPEFDDFNAYDRHIQQADRTDSFREPALDVSEKKDVYRDASFSSPSSSDPYQSGYRHAHVVLDLKNGSDLDSDTSGRTTPQSETTDATMRSFTPNATDGTQARPLSFQLPGPPPALGHGRDEPSIADLIEHAGDGVASPSPQDLMQGSSFDPSSAAASVPAEADPPAYEIPPVLVFQQPGLPQGDHHFSRESSGLFKSFQSQTEV